MISSVKETVLEIDLRALRKNYCYLRSKVSQGVKFLCVVKAYAYGSESIAIAKCLGKEGADYFAVAYAHEGVALRKAGIQTPIMVLHPLPSHFEEIIGAGLEPSLYSAKSLKNFISVAEKMERSAYPIHIKFNTGLNRLGFWENDVTFVVGCLKETKSVKVCSILSHLAASEDPNEEEFTRRQITTFRQIGKVFKAKMNHEVMMHQSNTSAILNYSESHFDMVRSGIGLYGFGNDPKFDEHLTPVASLKSVISQIHVIEPGETVGYNRAYTAPHFNKTATIPVGHADGIGRHYGNGVGWVIIGGKKAAIVGNVCMDMLMVDVTGIDCKEGDEVIFFGKHPKASTMAGHAQTISYELITGISQRIKRVIKE